jgi:hypothetical protein
LPSTGGSNALTAAMLPKHTHTIYTDKTKHPDDISADKPLTGHLPSGAYPYSGDSRYHEMKAGTSGIVSMTQENNKPGSNAYDSDNARFYIDATHNHTGGANNDNSSKTDDNTSNMPAYYSLIYVIRLT